VPMKGIKINLIQNMILNKRISDVLENKKDIPQIFVIPIIDWSQWMGETMINTVYAKCNDGFENICLYQI
jgi:hypothetical protein